MAHRKTLNVSLTPHHQKLVAAAVRTGEFGSASEVVREGLRLYEDRQRRRARVAELRSLIAEGVAEADRGELRDAGEVFDEVRARSAARRRART